MKFPRQTIVLIFFSGLLGMTALSCAETRTADGTAESTPRIIQTIHPATLTAISEMAVPSQTPVPALLEVDGEALDGLVLDFWYIWDLDEPGEGMNAIVDRFNQENEWGITINAHDQGLVLDPLAAVEAAFEEGIVPHIMVSDSSTITGWYQDGLTVDLSDFMDDPAAGLPEKDQLAFFPGIFEGFLLKDSVRAGMPFSQSIQVIYYNQSWARELGLHGPLLSASDFQDQSCNPIEDGTAAAIFSPQSANILSFIYAYQGDPLDENENEYQFSSTSIRHFADDWRTLFEEGCGQLIANYPNPMAVENEYERFNRREALMIMGSSLIWEHIQPSPDQSNRMDEWEMLPFLGPEGGKAVTSEVQSIVVFKSSPVEELGSWLFLKYLISSEVQAEWSQYSAYYPTRKDCLWFLREFRAGNPTWAQGLNLLKYSKLPPLHPSWQNVQLAVEDAFEEILSSPDLDLDGQLEALDLIAAELMELSLK